MREEVPNIEEGGADLPRPPRHLHRGAASTSIASARHSPLLRPRALTTFVCVTPPSPLARHQARDALQHPYFDEVRSHRHRALASSLLRAPIRAASDRRYVRSPTPRCLGSRTFSVRRITCAVVGHRRVARLCERCSDAPAPPEAVDPPPEAVSLSEAKPDSLLADDAHAELWGWLAHAVKQMKKRKRTLRHMAGTASRRF